MKVVMAEEAAQPAQASVTIHSREEPEQMEVIQVAPVAVLPEQVVQEMPRAETLLQLPLPVAVQAEMVVAPETPVEPVARQAVAVADRTILLLKPVAMAPMARSSLRMWFPKALPLVPLP